MRWLKQLGDLLLAGLLVAFADGVLFHAGVYFPLLRPESHSGEVARHERRLGRSIEAGPGRNRIVVMGNSVSAAAIQEGQLEAGLNAAGLPFHAVNMAAPSTAPDPRETEVEGAHNGRPYNSELKIQERLDAAGSPQDHRPDGERKDRGA